MHGHGDGFMPRSNYVPPFGQGIFNLPNFYPPPRHPFPGFDIPPYPPRYMHPFPVTPSSVMLMPNLMVPIPPGLTVGMNPRQHTLYCQSLARLHQNQGLLPPSPTRVIVLPPVQFTCPYNLLHPTYEYPPSQQFANYDVPTASNRTYRTENRTRSLSESGLNDIRTENNNSEFENFENNERPAQSNEASYSASNDMQSGPQIPRPIFDNGYIPLQEYPFDQPSPVYGHPGFISFPGFRPYYGNGLLPTPYSYSNPYEYIAYGYSYAQQHPCNMYSPYARYRQRCYHRPPRSPPTLRPESPGTKSFGPRMSRLEKFLQTHELKKQEDKIKPTIGEEKSSAVENKISTVEKTPTTVQKFTTVKETSTTIEGTSTTFKKKCTTVEETSTTVEEKSTTVVQKITDVQYTTSVLTKSQKHEAELMKVDVTPMTSSEEIISTKPLTYAQILSGKKAKTAKTQRCFQAATKIEQTFTTVEEKSTTVEEKSTTVDEKSTIVEEKSTTVEEKSTTVEEKSTTVVENSITVEEKSKTVGEKSITVEEKSSTIVEKITDAQYTTSALTKSQKDEAELMNVDVSPMISSEEIISNKPLTYAQILSGKKAKTAKTQRCFQAATKIEQNKEILKTQIRNEPARTQERPMSPQQPLAPLSVAVQPMRKTYAQILKGFASDAKQGSPVTIGKPLAPSLQLDVFEKEQNTLNLETCKQEKIVILYSNADNYTNSSSSLSSTNLAPMIIENSNKRDVNIDFPELKNSRKLRLS